MLNEFLVQALKMIKFNQPESQAAKMESAEGVKYQHNFNFLFAAKQRFGWYIRLSLSSALTVHQMTRTQGQDVRANHFIEMLGQEDGIALHRNDPFLHRMNLVLRYFYRNVVVNPSINRSHL